MHLLAGQVKCSLSIIISGINWTMCIIHQIFNNVQMAFPAVIHDTIIELMLRNI